MAITLFGFALLLLHYLYYVIKTCPDDSLYVPCRNEGWEPSSCSSPVDSTKVIAFGYYPTWSYYEKTGGNDLVCNTAIFGDPVDHYKRCCKLQYDLSGESGLSPVVNNMSCGEAVEHYFKQGIHSDTHFWKFTLDETSLVTISNCDTLYDTQMYLRDYLGQRVPNSVVGCDGDDCNCPGWFDVNEAFVDVTLASGDYYIEIKPFDQYAAAGVFHLSLSCTAAPAPITPPTAAPITASTAAPTDSTNAPTPLPTLSGPTTPSPTGSEKRFCGKTENWWCYDIDLYPSLTKETNHTVFITNGDDNTQTVFVILATIYGNQCVKPSILFSFEEIDFSYHEEYIELYDNDKFYFANCTGSNDSICGHWIDCFHAPRTLGVDKIDAGETYRIYVLESAAIDALCTAYHPYSINAKLTISCSADSASPTTFPTVDPTSAPSVPPTSAPSNAPTVDPTTAPSAHPSHSPSNSPSKDPTERPTPSPVQIVAGGPTSGPSNKPSQSPNNDEREVDGDDDDGDQADDDEGEDDDDDSSENDASTQGEKGANTSITLMIIASVSLVAVCCVLVICIYYQLKRKHKPIQQSQTEEIELGDPEPEPKDTAAGGARESRLLIPSMSPAAGVQEHERYPSDMKVVQGLTPMGASSVDVHHEPGDSYAEEDVMGLPRLPSEGVPKTEDNSASDGEDDHEHDDLYIVPPQKETEGTATQGTDGNNEEEDDEGNEDEDEEDEDDEHNDLYGKPEHQQQTSGRAESDDSDEDEHDDLYVKQQKDDEHDTLT